MNLRKISKIFLLTIGGLFPVLLLALLIFLPSQAQAATTSFESAMCNATNIVTGNAGKAFAGFAIVSVGIGFFSGKISWGLMLGVAIGVGSIFGAPTVVAALSGNAVYECKAGETYVTTCSHGVCNSCPPGFGGSDCDECATGFTGFSCDTCAPGYVGDNCGGCDSGYSPFDGECHSDCEVSSLEGIADTLVQAGEGTLACDLARYIGTVSHTCENGILSITGSCDYTHCTGGTESLVDISGTMYKIHTFTSSGSLNCGIDKSVDYLVVAGGGGGGAWHGGGGGAGGFLEGSETLSSDYYSITVGSGGSQSINGGNSSLGSIAKAFGGGGGSTNGSATQSGGSGGGGSNRGNGGFGIIGQGNNGGNMPPTCCRGIGAGGGGAGSAASNANSYPTDGGDGKLSSINGVATYYAGGGGGGSWLQSSDVNASYYYGGKIYGIGGSGVGGDGGALNENGFNGAANTGGGGGGAGRGGAAGRGGSGIVIIRYVD